MAPEKKQDKNKLELKIHKLTPEQREKLLKRASDQLNAKLDTIEANGGLAFAYRLLRGGKITDDD